jgi:hypothetical protein
VFVGMPILEVGVDTILESTVSMIGRYDKNAHKGWDVDGKEWEWVLYHKRGNVLSIEEAKKKYGDFDKALGRDGVISYTPKLK